MDGGGGAHLGEPLRLQPQVEQRLGERGRVAARHEHAVDSVAHDVAVAGDLGGDDRRACSERLRQHHAEALAAERRRAEHVGGLQHAPLLVVVDATEHGDVAVVEQQRRDFLAVRADDRQLDRDVLAQRFEGAQQHRQALALDRLADERDPQAVGRLARRARRLARRRRSG